jgi:hypothetical protein
MQKGRDAYRAGQFPPRSRQARLSDSGSGTPPPDSTALPSTFRPYIETVVAIAPDGIWLATGGWDKTVQVRDAATGQHRATLTHVSRVTAVAIAPDGDLARHRQRRPGDASLARRHRWHQRRHAGR